MANKKTISPVVATALLLVVAVVAVVGFQTWFKDYQSGIQADAEQKSQLSANVDILELTNGTVYVKNGGADEIKVDIILEDDVCTEEGNVTIAGSSTKKVSLSDCAMKEGQKYSVTLMSNALDAPVKKTFLIS